MTLREIIEKCRKVDPKIWITLYVVISALVLYLYPPMQVSHFEINNSTTIATLENQYRTTLAQILGGGAVAIGIYFAWGNLTTAREGQITERFTRAVDQLGSDKVQIRLGGIYALERISNESEKDYWSIMEILTAYVRKNSSVDIVVNKKVTHLSIDIQTKESTITEVLGIGTISLDIQAVLTVLGQRKNFINYRDYKRINLRMTFLQEADLREAHFEGADFMGADLTWANLKRTDISEVLLERANLQWANLQLANLKGADLEGANLEEADLRGAKNLTIDQLSSVKTLYGAKLDEELEKSLREKYPALFDEPIR